MSKHIAIITDSTTDLPDEVLAEHGVTVVPIYLIWGGQELRDRVDITIEEFYQRLEADTEHPTTSQPSVQDFVDAVKRTEIQGADEALILTISSGMSGTYSSAVAAVPKCDIPVTVIDSRANSMSLGWQVLEAVRVRDGGGSVADIQAATQRVLANTITLAYIDTLDYLHRGGRINGIQKWVGTFFDLKPLIQVNHQTGKMEPLSRVRTRKLGLENLQRKFANSVDLKKRIHLGVVHGNRLRLAQDIAEQMQNDCNPVEIRIGMTSPAMGVHTGPGAIALCGYVED